MANLRVDKITSTETFEKTGSVQFDGVDGTNIQIDNSTDIQLGSETNWTIEFWALRTGAFVDYDVIVGKGDGSGTYEWFIEGFADGAVDFLHSTDGTTAWSGQDEILPSMDLNRWYHFAFVRNGSSFKAYVDGSETFSREAFNVAIKTGHLHIGGYGGATAQDPPVFLSNVRIINGVSIYTSNFKPPMRELEVVPGTVLLACQSKTDATLEKTDKTITVNGNAVASELTPGILTPIVKSGGGSAITGSVEFDGTGDYLSVQSSTDFDFGTGDFTIELYVNLGNLTSRNIFARNDSNPSNTGILLWQNGSSQLQWYSSVGNTTGVITVTTPLTLHEWAHIAVSRESNTTRLFANGVLIGSVSDSTNISGNSALVTGSTFSGDGYYLKGFISNLRMVKGTALYTDDFIPPTRELKRVPGTVLLACQDPDNPLTEATGKTITGYGSLQRTDGPELVTNGYFNNGTTGWSVTGGAIAVTSGQLQLTNSNTTLGKVDQTITTVVGQTYQVSALVTPDGGGHFPRLYVGADNDYTPVVSSANIQQLVTVIYTAVSTSTVISLNSNTNNANAVTLLDDVSAYDISYDADAPASNFTPQVGDDRKVTFEGVTKIDTDAYFYLPTGDTITRDSRSGRGLIRMGPGMSYITISSLGNSKDFGDNTVDALNTSACASSTRGLFAQGYKHPLYYKTIDYVTIASTGDAKDFGDITTSASFVYGMGGCASSTRGLFAGGFTAPSPNAAAGLKQINYVTIASLGDSQDFGDLTGNGVRYPAATSSPTRGIFGGGRDSADSPVYNQNVIHYVTIATLGNANNFGDLTDSLYSMAATGSATRGIFAGGYNPAGNSINLMDYITISSTGNAQDFGDLYLTRGGSGASSNATRATFAGGANPSAQNVIDYVTIQSTGNALDFGDLLTTMYAGSGCSDSHGGLG